MHARQHFSDHKVIPYLSPLGPRSWKKILPAQQGKKNRGQGNGYSNNYCHIIKHARLKSGEKRSNSRYATIITVLLSTLVCALCILICSCYYIRKRNKFETQLFQIKSHSTNIDSNIPIEGNTNNSQNSINKDISPIMSDRVIALELQKHEHDLSNITDNNTQTSNGECIDPINSNEDGNESILNDELISVELQRNNIDLHQLTKGQINTNEFITSGNDIQ